MCGCQRATIKTHRRLARWLLFLLWQQQQQQQEQQRPPPAALKLKPRWSNPTQSTPVVAPSGVSCCFIVTCSLNVIVVFVIVVAVVAAVAICCCKSSRSCCKCKQCKRRRQQQRQQQQQAKPLASRRNVNKIFFKLTASHVAYTHLQPLPLPLHPPPTLDCHCSCRKCIYICNVQYSRLLFILLPGPNCCCCCLVGILAFVTCSICSALLP